MDSHAYCESRTRPTCWLILIIEKKEEKETASSTSI